MIEVQIDGSAKPNPGKGGMGIVIHGDGWDYTISERIISKDRVSNNEAEYKSLYRALVELVKNRVTASKICIMSDSEMLVLQMKGERKVDKGGRYVEDYLRAKRLSVYFINLEFKYIPREENSEANLLASKSLKY